MIPAGTCIDNGLFIFSAWVIDVKKRESMKDFPAPIPPKHVNARRIDYCRQLEREHIHLTLLSEVNRGWDDVESGRLLSVIETRAKYKNPSAADSP